MEYKHAKDYLIELAAREDTAGWLRDLIIRLVANDGILTDEDYDAAAEQLKENSPSTLPLPDSADTQPVSEIRLLHMVHHGGVNALAPELYMMVSGNYGMTSEQLRRYYVGVTRAKKNLTIFTNGKVFDKGPVSVQHFTDASEYPLPEEIVLQLTHKDVVLSYFSSRKKDVLSLQGGDALRYNDGFLISPSTGKYVAKLSARMFGNLRQWEEKGYQVRSSSVRFVVAWRAKDAPKDEPETAVLLPEMRLVKGL